jgi:ribosomal RNA-processing protein 36
MPRDEDIDLERIRRRANMMTSDDESSYDDSGDEGNEDANFVPNALAGDGSDDESGEGGDYRSDDESEQGEGSSSGEDDLVESSNELDNSDDGSGSESEGDDDDVARRRKASRKPPGELTFAERLALKMDGSDDVVQGRNSHSKSWTEVATAAAATSSKAKKQKNAPMEMSTKWAVGRHRDVVDVKKVERRDPRFQGGDTTELKGRAAEEAAAFLESKRVNELQSVNKALAKEKKRRGGRAGGADSRLETLKQTAARLKQVGGERQRAASEAKAKSEWKQTERAAVAAGKQPFYLKRGQARELVMNKHFEELRKGKGGKKRVEKLVEKKRKKHAVKERKWMPEERGGQPGGLKRQRNDGYSA